VDGPRAELTGERSWFWLWDAYILAVYAMALVYFLGSGAEAVRRLGAAAALTGLVLWYLLFGRRVIRSGDEGARAYGFVAGALALFVVELAFIPDNSIVLFGLYPMIFMAIPLRFALPGVVLASALPTLVRAVEVGLSADYLRHGLFIPVGGIVVSGVMGTFLTRTARLSEQRAELIERLEASRAEVARLSREAGTAAERARLAREIHDTLAQGFASIVTLVQAAESELDGEPGKARGHLALAVRTARENLAEARAMVAALTPSALDGSSLDEAVRDQVNRFAAENGIAATYRTIGAPVELPTPVEVVLLRAVQEALTNIRKHAKASTATVTLRFTDSAVILSVTDDGTGLATMDGTGFGLRGMRARADEVSGTLVVHAGAGQGTRLELEVPR
jgi:signal transduction histidine kinase